MEWLNYHHLQYFWVVARTGSIKRACEELHVTQPTVSSQLQALEDALGQKLFIRRPRKLLLTEAGRVVFRYADEIFSLGREMTTVLQGQPPGRPSRFVVGVTDSLPKMVAYKLLEAALEPEIPSYLVCEEGKQSHLLARLESHDLDLVLADAPIPSDIRIHAFNHFLGESGVLLFGTAALAKRYRKHYPGCLTGAPLLFPKAGTLFRRDLNSWLSLHHIEPQAIGEFEDSAMQKAFGCAGRGLFPGSAVMEKEICRQYDVDVVGEVETVKQRFYAHTVHRRLKHPAVQTIAHLAKHQLFSLRQKP